MSTEPKWRAYRCTGTEEPFPHEWWSITDGEIAFEANNEIHADWLCGVLNKLSAIGEVKAKSPFPPHEIIAWDWREQCPHNDVIDACKRFGSGAVSFDVETNCDEYAVVIGGSELTQEIAQSIYES
jgi:hypothetical protein